MGQNIRNGNVYVGVLNNLTCKLVNWPMGYPFTFCTNPTIIAGFTKPRAIAITQAGEPIVLDRDVRRVSRIKK